LFGSLGGAEVGGDRNADGDGILQPRCVSGGGDPYQVEVGDRADRLGRGVGGEEDVGVAPRHQDGLGDPGQFGGVQGDAGAYLAALEQRTEEAGDAAGVAPPAGEQVRSPQHIGRYVVQHSLAERHLVAADEHALGHRRGQQRGTQPGYRGQLHRGDRPDSRQTGTGGAEQRQAANPGG